MFLPRIPIAKRAIFSDVNDIWTLPSKYLLTRLLFPMLPCDNDLGHLKAERKNVKRYFLEGELTTLHHEL